MTAITPKQFAEETFAMLKQCVAEEYEDATEQEREQAMVRILDAWSEQMFMGPKEKNHGRI
jgi:uncharacterized protein YbjQ (UPF0145 family)